MRSKKINLITFFKVNIDRRSKDAATHDHMQKYDLSNPAQQNEIESSNFKCIYRSRVYKQQAPAVVN